MTYPIEQASTGFSRRPSTCQPGVVNLINYATATFGLHTDGCYNPASLMSSGTPSWHVYGKAADMACNWYDGRARPAGDRYFHWLIDNREGLQLQQAIWGDLIWDVSYGLRGYHHDDHKNHVHAALGYQASQTWHSGAVITIGDDEMNSAQEAKLDKAIILLTSIIDIVNWCANWLSPGGYAKRMRTPTAPRNGFLYNLAKKAGVSGD